MISAEKTSSLFNKRHLEDKLVFQAQEEVHFIVISTFTGVTMLRTTDPHAPQEVTVAVLPFFHIYAMNTIMTLGLQIGAKLVTLPKFEPEEYIQALVTYKVQGYL